MKKSRPKCKGTKKEEKMKQTNCQTIAFLEPARLVLSAAMPGHPGGSTFARHLGSTTIHNLGADCILHILCFCTLQDTWGVQQSET